MKKLIISIDKLNEENLTDIVLPKDICLYIVAGENAQVPLRLLMLLKNLGDSVTMLEADTDVSFAFQLGLMCAGGEGKKDIAYIGSLELPDNLPLPPKVSFTRFPDLKTFLKPVKKTPEKEKMPRVSRKQVVKKEIAETKPEPAVIRRSDPDSLISMAFKKSVKSLINGISDEEIEKIAVAFTKANSDVVLDMQMRFVLGTEKGNQYTEILKPHFNKLKKIIF